MFRRLIAPLAAAALFITLPKLAEAKTVVYGTSSPVDVTVFTVEQHHIPASLGIYGTHAGFSNRRDSGTVELTFINKSAVPVTTVKFTIAAGDLTHHIVDKGTFSPGVAIRHRFDVDRGLARLSKGTYSVSEVDFADGSVWYARRPKMSPVAQS